MPNITVRFTVLNPAGGNAWDGAMNDAVTMANMIFSSRRGGVPFTVREAVPRLILPQADCERLLTRNCWDGVQQGASPSVRQAQYNQYRRQGALSGGEFQLQAASTQAYAPGAGVVSNEARGILALNRRPGEVAVYWVPSIAEGSGHTICRPYYNVLPSEEGIFMCPNPDPGTLAHELGHLLMEIGHCEFPATHASRACPNTCAPPANLMHWYGGGRTGTSLSAEQWTRFETIGHRKGYF